MSHQNALNLKLINAKSKEHLDEITKLFKEYAASLGFSLCFQNFDEELTGLPGEYAPPRGSLLLAFVGMRVVGCVALRPLTKRYCEMKRLYIRPKFRKKGIGKELSVAIIEKARKLGYTRMRLDTLASMTEAITLYKTLGFKKIKPYRYNPLKGAVYMELNLK